MSALRMGLQSALQAQSSELVAKAAAIATSRYVTDVVPDLLAAYDRFFVDSPAVDRLVVGRQAIAQALKDLDYRNPAPFLQGLQYCERSWGSDPAAGLRVTCAHALVACEIDGKKRYELLIDHLVDTDRTVRREVVRAIAQIGGHESLLLLRLKAIAGDAVTKVVPVVCSSQRSQRSRGEPRSRWMIWSRYLWLQLRRGGDEQRHLGNPNVFKAALHAVYAFPSGLAKGELRSWSPRAGSWFS